MKSIAIVFFGHVAPTLFSRWLNLLLLKLRGDAFVYVTNRFGEVRELGEMLATVAHLSTPSRTVDTKQPVEMILFRGGHESACGIEPTHSCATGDPMTR